MSRNDPARVQAGGAGSPGFSDGGVTTPFTVPDGGCCEHLPNPAANDRSPCGQATSASAFGAAPVRVVVDAAHRHVHVLVHGDDAFGRMSRKRRPQLRLGSVTVDDRESRSGAVVLQHQVLMYVHRPTVLPAAGTGILRPQQSVRQDLGRNRKDERTFALPGRELGRRIEKRPPAVPRHPPARVARGV